MTDDEMIVEIAEACGWRSVDVYEWDTAKTPPVRLPKQYHRDEGGMPHGLPDYLNDLNACSEMENMFDGQQLVDYGTKLYGVVGAHWTWRATARQRCEAFLRVIGKWK